MVPEALGRQVDGLDVVDVLGGDSEAIRSAGATQRLVSEDARRATADSGESSAMRRMTSGSIGGFSGDCSFRGHIYDAYADEPFAYKCQGTRAVSA